MKLLRYLMVVAGLLLVAQTSALAQGRGGPVFDPYGCQPPACIESDWIYDDVSKNHTTVWRHNMGVTPRAISILFSPDPDKGRVFPLVWPWQWQQTGNPQTMEMGRRAVLLHILAGAPLHGVWRPESGWTQWREGYWKIIVYR